MAASARLISAALSGLARRKSWPRVPESVAPGSSNGCSAGSTCSTVRWRSGMISRAWANVTPAAPARAAISTSRTTSKRFMTAPSTRHPAGRLPNGAIMRQGLLWLFCFAAGLPWAPGCNASSVERDRALSHALYALGVQYRWGGASPESGFDCSGLVTYVFERAWGLALPRSTEGQRRVGTPVRLKELEPGDLIFYN